MVNVAATTFNAPTSPPSPSPWNIIITPSTILCSVVPAALVPSIADVVSYRGDSVPCIAKLKVPNIIDTASAIPMKPSILPARTATLLPNTLTTLLLLWKAPVRKVVASVATFIAGVMLRRTEVYLVSFGVLSFSCCSCFLLTNNLLVVSATNLCILWPTFLSVCVFLLYN